MTDTQSTTKRTFTVGEHQIELDLALYSNGWNAGSAARQQAMQTVPKPAQPEKPELKAAPQPQVALHNEGGAFVRLDNGGRAFGKHIADQDARLALVFEHKGEAVTVNLTRDQLRVLANQMLGVADILDVNMARIENYRAEMREYEDSDKVRNQQLDDLRDEVRRVYRDVVGEVEDEDDDDIF